MGQRIVTGLGLVALLTVLMYLGGWVLTAAACICVLVCLQEEHQALLHNTEHLPLRWPTWAGIIVGALLTPVLGDKVIIPMLLCVMLLNIILVMLHKEPSLEDILFSNLPLFHVVLPGLCIVSLTTVSPRELQLVLLSLLFVVPVLCDTLAYFVGTRIGGPKLCPKISPNKTISGAIGGLAGGFLGALLILIISHFAVPAGLQHTMPHWWGILLLGLTGGAVGQIGDLFASLIKRRCGIKDYSDLFPGHGGMLDRLDSILFMAILIFCYRLMVA